MKKTTKNKIKKILFLTNLIFILILAGCSNKGAQSPSTKETILYQSENGLIEVPSEAKRIIVLNSALSGHILALNKNVVGIDKWTKDNPTFSEIVKDIPVVSDENLEQILELNPDLIVTASTDKNLDKLKEIAPTVTFTYGKVDYLTQFIEIGKLLNKEEEAKNWVEDFKLRAKSIGNKIKEKIGENATVSVVESYEKQIYVFGKNFARATEILYNEMDIKMPNAVKENTENSGYYAISSEVLYKFSGDYVIFSKNPDADNSFQNTKLYKNIEAVKNNRVFEISSKGFFFNDPVSLEIQLKFIEKSFLDN